MRSASAKESGARLAMPRLPSHCCHWAIASSPSPDEPCRNTTTGTLAWPLARGAFCSPRDRGGGGGGGGGKEEVRAGDEALRGSLGVHRGAACDGALGRWCWCLCMGPCCADGQQCGQGWRKPCFHRETPGSRHRRCSAPLTGAAPPRFWIEGSRSARLAA